MDSRTLSIGGRTIAELSFSPTTFQGGGSGEYPYFYLQGKLKFNPPANPRVDFLLREANSQLNLVDHGTIAHSLTHQMQRWYKGNWNFSYEEFVNLNFPLDRERIAVLERVRNGGDVSLRLFVEIHIEEHGIVQGEEVTKRPAHWGLADVHRLPADFQLTVPRSTWVEQVLPRLDYGRVHLVELPAVPISACERLKSSFEALKQAEHRHKVGLYDDAVGKCRIALEPLLERVEKKEENGSVRQYSILRKTWERRLGKATYEWLNNSFRAVKEAANPNHHSAKEHYDQFESQMILAITTTLIAFAARHEDAEA